MINAFLQIIQGVQLKRGPLSHEYFTSDAIYNGFAGMTLYYYMCRSWQDCYRRGEKRSLPSVSVESVNSECWFFEQRHFLRFHNVVKQWKNVYLFWKVV
jgi:hypothetical protein